MVEEKAGRNKFPPRFFCTSWARCAGRASVTLRNDLQFALVLQKCRPELHGVSPLARTCVRVTFLTRTKHGAPGGMRLALETGVRGGCPLDRLRSTCRHCHSGCCDVHQCDRRVSSASLVDAPHPCSDSRFKLSRFAPAKSLLRSTPWEMPSE